MYKQNKGPALLKQLWMLSVLCSRKYNTWRLSAAGQEEAESPHSAGNTTLQDEGHHTQLVVRSVDCGQHLMCTASLSRQTVLAQR